MNIPYKLVLFGVLISFFSACKKDAVHPSTQDTLNDCLLVRGGKGTLSAYNYFYNKEGVLTSYNYFGEGTLRSTYLIARDEINRILQISQYDKNENLESIERFSYNGVDDKVARIDYFEVSNGVTSLDNSAVFEYENNRRSKKIYINPDGTENTTTSYVYFDAINQIEEQVYNPQNQDTYRALYTYDPNLPNPRNRAIVHPNHFLRHALLRKDTYDYEGDGGALNPSSSFSICYDFNQEDNTLTTTPKDFSGNIYLGDTYYFDCN